MQFDDEQWERQFQLTFDRGCMRTDLLYSLCLAAFGLSAAYRLQPGPGNIPAYLTAAALCTYLPLQLLLQAWWPAHYLRHRQPLAATLKVATALLATQLRQRRVKDVCAAALAGSAGPAELLLRAGAALPMQLVLHAIGFHTTGAWLVLSQGFAVAASARLPLLCCECYLAMSVQQLLEGHQAVLRRLGMQWLVGAAPGVLCQAYTLGLQVGAGFCGAAICFLALEWRQRQEFAAKQNLPPPSLWGLLSLAGFSGTMLLSLLRLLLALLAPPQCGEPATAGAATAAASSCAATTRG